MPATGLHNDSTPAVAADGPAIAQPEGSLLLLLRYTQGTRVGTDLAAWLDLMSPRAGQGSTSRISGVPRVANHQ